MNSVSSFGVRVLGSLLLVIILAAVVVWPVDLVVAALRMAQASAITEGVVLESASVASNTPISENQTYRSVVTYEYEVLDRRLAGSRVAPGLLTSIFSPDGGAVAREHPPGSRVTVYYDPNRPEFSFIQAGYLTLSAGLTLIGVGVAVLGGLKQFGSDWSRPLWFSALLYASLPAGFLILLLLPDYVEGSRLVTVAGYYALFSAGIYVILLVVRLSQRQRG